MTLPQHPFYDLKDGVSRLYLHSHGENKGHKEDYSTTQRHHFPNSKLKLLTIRMLNV